MSKHKRRKTLAPEEIRSILDSADEFHRIICRPLISPYCAHYQALHRLGEAIRLAITEISGQDAPWVSRSSSRPSQGTPGGNWSSSDAEGDRSP